MPGKGSQDFQQESYRDLGAFTTGHPAKTPSNSRCSRDTDLFPFKTEVLWDMPHQGLRYPAVAVPGCGQPREGCRDRPTLSHLLPLLLLLPNRLTPHQTPQGPKNPDWQRLRDLPLAALRHSRLGVRSFRLGAIYFKALSKPDVLTLPNEAPQKG